MHDWRSKVLRLAGAAFLLASSLSLGIEWAARRDRTDAVRLSQLPDASGRASAAYHGAHADVTLSGRWGWTGHGTWGVLLVLAGAGLLLRGRRARAS